MTEQGDARGRGDPHSPVDRALETALRTVFQEAFGDQPAALQFHLDLKGLAVRPREALATLRSYLGRAAVPVEQRIVKQFYEQLGLPMEQMPGWTLADYIVRARALYLRQIIDGP